MEKKNYIISAILFIIAIVAFNFLGEFTILKVLSAIAIGTSCPIVIFIINYYEKDFKLYSVINAAVYAVLLGVLVILYFTGKLTQCVHEPSDWIKDSNGYMHTECKLCGEVLQRRPQADLSIATPDKKDFLVEADSSMIEEETNEEINVNSILNDDYKITEDTVRDENKTYYICDAYGELTKYSGKEAGTYLELDEYFFYFGKYLVDNGYVGNETEWEEILSKALKEQSIIEYCSSINLIVFEKKF